MCYKVADIRHPADEEVDGQRTVNFIAITITDIIISTVTTNVIINNNTLTIIINNLLILHQGEL